MKSSHLLEWAHESMNSHRVLEMDSSMELESAHQMMSFPPMVQADGQMALPLVAHQAFEQVSPALEEKASS